MRQLKQFGCRRVALILALVVFGSPWAGADSLRWEKGRGQVSAEITDWDLARLLDKIAEVTGWQVYVEPNTRHTTTAKFRDRPPGEALQLLLGDLNFAVLPQTNAPSRLLVYKTSLDGATQLVRPSPKVDLSKPIPNELIVTLKKGANIDELAKKLGAKVIGRAEGRNAYRLSFESEDAAKSARELLTGDSNVESIDSNYSISRPEDPFGLTYGSGTPLNIKAKPFGEGSPLIALIDTAIQKTGTPLDEFLLSGISVAGLATVSDGQPTHGTSMFETMMSMQEGSSSIRILPVDVYGPNSETSTFDVGNGILQAVNGGATIVNLSLGGSSRSDYLQNIIQEATRQGVLFLAAAGNQPTTAATYPAAYPEVLAVTSRTRDGSVAPYANRGDFVSLAAPGTSLIEFGGRSWLITGTSASTALASGIAGKLADGTGASAQQVRQQLQQLLAVQKNSTP